MTTIAEPQANASAQKQNSFWLEDNNRVSYVTSRITGIKLHEAGVAGYFFNKKQTFRTTFTFECKIANYTWTVSRMFAEFQTFHADLLNIYFLEARERIKVCVCVPGFEYNRQ